jgi:hypothetical protein
MNYLMVLIACLFSLGCSGNNRYEIIKQNEVKKLNLIVDRLGYNEDGRTTGSCGYTIQQLLVLKNQLPTAAVFRIYPINTGHGTLMVQLAVDDNGKPGKAIIDEWIITHDGSRSSFDDSILLHFCKPLMHGTYWLRFIDSHNAINTLTFNCRIICDDTLIRYINSNGDTQEGVIGFGLVK